MASKADRFDLPGRLRRGPTRKPTSWLPLLATLSLGLSGCMTPVNETQGLSEHDRALEQAQARRDLGVQYLASGRNAIALRELLFSATKNPADPETQLWLGEGYRRQRHDEKALAAMLRAVELKPDYQAAHNNLSAFYIQLERYPEAIEHAQVLIDDPLYARPWMAFSNRGRAEFKLGRISDARASLETALEFRADFWPAALNLGILEREAGNAVKAVKYLQRVIKHPVGEGPRAEASFLVAQILVSAGHREKAMRYFAASVKTDPGSSWAEESRDYLERLR